MGKEFTELEREFVKRSLNDPVLFAKAFFNDGPSSYFIGKGIPSFLKPVSELVSEEAPMTLIALPRDSAKTTFLGKCYMLQQLLRKPTYARVFSATKEHAIKLGEDHARQLTQNEKLTYYFGNQEGPIWASSRRELKNGSYIEYLGQGSKQSKGATSSLGRPLVNLFDDVERTEDVQSDEVQRRIIDWFYQDIVPSIPFDIGGRIIMVTTLANKRSLGYRIATGEIPGWKVIRLAACNFDTNEVLWKERFTIEYWRNYREQMARAGQLYKFNAEFMNDPLDPSAMPFKAEMVNYYDELPKKLRLFCAIDLAYATKRESDYTAVLVGGTDNENNLYIIEASQNRWDPEARVNGIINLVKKYHLRTINIEGHVDFVEHTLPLAMKRANVWFNIKKLHPGSRSKEDRIKDLQPALTSIMFHKHKHRAILEQLLGWAPKSKAHDDLIDALAYLRQVAKRNTDGGDIEEVELGFDNASRMSQRLHKMRQGLASDDSNELFKAVNWRER